MDVDVLADPRVQRGDHERMAVVHEADVRDQRLVEDGLDGVALVGGLLVHAAHAHPLGWRRGAAAGARGAHKGRMRCEVVLCPEPLTGLSMGPIM